MYQETSNQLKQSQHILIASHIHPDGDAIGAALALGNTMRSLGKQVVIYNEHTVPPAYRFLPGSEKMVTAVGPVSDYDVVVVMDCTRLDRIGALSVRIGDVPVINIDHHLSNDHFGLFRIVEHTASATAEIVYRLIKRMMGIPITPEIAYPIYTGIITDTASFSFSNTTSAAFTICGEMVAAGVDPAEVARRIYITYSSERIKFMRMVLDTFALSSNRKVSFMMATQEMIRKSGMQPEHVGRFVNYAKHIEDVKISALALESDQRREGLPEDVTDFHVSLRSDGSIDVAEIAAAFGGGGHHRAAGFNISTTLQGIRDTILGLADDFDG
ncbi:MAG: bifunctional oligoribonuclease/PAP phosphatase NrnA [Thermodesulfobacteriota bacterium]